MISPPLVDVVIPVYNVADYLSKCVTSVMSQTYSNVRIILVDDGSTDNSGAISDYYADVDPRIEVVHQENSGLSAARNIGISRSDGDYITFVDSDDVVSETYVENLVHAAESAGCDIAIGGFNRFVDDGELKSSVQRLSSMNYAVLDCVDALMALHDNTKRCSFTAWGKLYRRTLFDNSNMLFPVGRLHEDDYLTHKLIISAKRVVFSGSCDYYYRIRETGIMGVRSQQSYRDAVDARRERYAAYLALGDADLSAIGLRDVVVSCIQYWRYLDSASNDDTLMKEVLSLCRSIIKDSPRSLLCGRVKLRIICMFPYAPALISFLVGYRGR